MIAVYPRYPGGFSPPDPSGTFCVNKKYPKSHLNLRFKNPFLGAACSAASLGEGFADIGIK